MSTKGGRSKAAATPAEEAPASRAAGTAPPAAPRSRAIAIVLVALVTAVGIALSVANRIEDPDLWQHLAVGKAIWQQHAVPLTHLWTWPMYGQPDVLPSWLFRTLLWPFWDGLGAGGLFLWRALTTLAAFAILYLASRRMGARGLAPFVVAALCAILYRQRSQVRPETLVAVLLAIQIAILEARRNGGPDRSLWLIAIAVVWINAHISYHLGLLLTGIYWLDAWLTERRARSKGRGRRGPVRPAGPATAAAPPRALPLFYVLAAGIAVSFLNPFGWRAVWQPFDYVLHLRHEPIFSTILELQPVWGFPAFHARNGLPLLLLGWPVLAFLRARRHGFDLAELLLGLAFVGFGLTSSRFVGFTALVAMPFMARDASQVLARRGRRERFPLALRAGATAAACAAMFAFEWSGPLGPPAYTLTRNTLPVAACEFMAEHGVRGRGFNQFYLGGYQIFRFWPDRERLPFMDIHVSGTPEDRLLYMTGQVDSTSWENLDAKHRFDYVLLTRRPPLGETLLDRLDADPRWALVFVDDAAALYVRRDGVAREAGAQAYLRLPAGNRRLGPLRAQCMAVPESCAVLIAELERAAASSPRNSDVKSLLANVAMTQGRMADARRELIEALEANPETMMAHERLGLIALQEGNAEEALREAERARRVGGGITPDLVAGRAYLRLGDRDAARSAYERVLRRDPANLEAADSLRVIRESGR